MTTLTERACVTDDIVTAVLEAEAEAVRQHEAGTCHLSEWSCSHCESASSDAEDQAARMGA